MTPPTPATCLDCANLSASIVLKYYEQGIWLLLPFDKYEPFVRWAGAVGLHQWQTCEKGVMIRKLIE